MAGEKDEDRSLNCGSGYVDPNETDKATDENREIYYD